jgi:hypothetical protein
MPMALFSKREVAVYAVIAIIGTALTVWGTMFVALKYIASSRSHDPLQNKNGLSEIQKSNGLAR